MSLFIAILPHNVMKLSLHLVPPLTYNKAKFKKMSMNLVNQCCSVCDTLASYAMGHQDGLLLFTLKDEIYDTQEIHHWTLKTLGYDLAMTYATIDIFWGKLWVSMFIFDDSAVLRGLVWGSDQSVGGGAVALFLSVKLNMKLLFPLGGSRLKGITVGYVKNRRHGCWVSPLACPIRILILDVAPLRNGRAEPMTG